MTGSDEQGWKANAEAALRKNSHHNEVNQVRRRFYDAKKSGLSDRDAAAVAQKGMYPERVEGPTVEIVKKAAEPDVQTDAEKLAELEAAGAAADAEDEAAIEAATDNPDEAVEPGADVANPVAEEAAIEADTEDEGSELDEALNTIT